MLKGKKNYTRENVSHQPVFFLNVALLILSEAIPKIKRKIQQQLKSGHKHSILLGSRDTCIE